MIHPKARTIVEQLGGRKFMAMTGIKEFLTTENSVSFRLPGGGGFANGGINHVTINLNPSDTYTITFRRIRGRLIKSVDVREGIYLDLLQEVFTRVTGLETHL